MSCHGSSGMVGYGLLVWDMVPGGGIWDEVPLPMMVFPCLCCAQGSPRVSSVGGQAGSYSLISSQWGHLHG